MKIRLGAVIPTTQYGNIQPEFEMDVDDVEVGMRAMEAKIQELWEKYGERPLKIDSNRKLIEAFCGGSIYYDETTHTYSNEAGEKYLSGSEYANSFKKKFDLEAISAALAKKMVADPEAIKQMWKLKSEASKDFGNAIHKSLQLYEAFNGLATQLEKTTNLHDHPVLKDAVEGFHADHKGETAYNEVMVVDHSQKRAGQIDRLLIIDAEKKICRVQDFKTNADISKEIEIYWKQLEFYEDILKTDGWTVEGLDIFWYTGVWETFSK